LTDFVVLDKKTVCNHSSEEQQGELLDQIGTHGRQLCGAGQPGGAEGHQVPEVGLQEIIVLSAGIGVTILVAIAVVEHNG